MSTKFWSAILACIVLSSGTAASAQVDLGIITGSEKGTYYQFEGIRGEHLPRLSASGLCGIFGESGPERHQELSG